MQRYSRLLMIILFAISACQSPASIKPTEKLASSPLPIASVPPTSLTLPTTFTLPEKCQNPFQKSRDIWNSTSNRQMSYEWESIIFSQMIEDGENYLNDCTNPDLPLTLQPDKLKILNQSVGLVATDADEKPNFSATQFLDWNKDSIDELLLYTKVFYPIGFIFHLNSVVKQWKGTMIWPPLTNSDRFKQPSIYLLGFSDSFGRPFVAVEGEFLGGDHGSNILTIWRWTDDKPEFVLKIVLSDWCGQPNEWQITEGYILIPPANATQRCESRGRLILVPERDRFIIKNPDAIGYGYSRGLGYSSGSCLPDLNWSALLEVCNY